MWKFTGWSRLIWRIFVKVRDNWIKFGRFTRICTCNKRVKFRSKIISLWGKYRQKTLGGQIFLTRTVDWIKERRPLSVTYVPLQVYSSSRGKCYTPSWNCRRWKSGAGAFNEHRGRQMKCLDTHHLVPTIATTSVPLFVNNDQRSPLAL